MIRSLCLALLCLLAFSSPSAAPVQQLDFPAAAAGDDAALTAAMPALAKQVLAAYRETDQDTYLDNLFRVQMVAGQYADAVKTLAALKALRGESASPQVQSTDVLYQVIANAKVEQGSDKSSYDAAFRTAFQEVFGRLDDQTSALASRALDLYHGGIERALRNALAQQKGKSSISSTDALALIRAYLVERSYRDLTPLAAPLVLEEDQRRYAIDEDIPVKTPDGATVCALVVRPRSGPARLPTLLTFTIYADPSSNLEVRSMFDEARLTASRGYASVIGLARGKGCSPDQPVPYEHDGADADALIDWISRQPWSDGRVGMYGGSYNGFTQWAAAKHLPKALKAMMPSVAAAPGIDVPMEGNVFESFVYPWPFYTTDVKGLDDEIYFDGPRWNKLNHDWYVSGRPYRDLDKIDGKANLIFDRWLGHPGYDAYWQSMIPYREEFQKIDIPVLATAGYFFGGPGAVTYYFSQHYKYDPKAEQYLLIGPYDHFMGQVGTVGILGGNTTNLAGYELDPVALLDLEALRYQWFDYIFKGAAKPALLKDKVNYEVMGANVWKHAPSLAAMGNQTLRFHMTALPAGGGYRLSEPKPADDAFIAQTLDLKDRSDADRISPSSGIVDKHLDTWDGVSFLSDPFPKATEVSGLFSGELDFVTNRQDLDFDVQLYELTPEGDYVQMSYYMARASYVADRSQRQLLTPGRRVRLDFRSERLTSRLFQPGSRLVVVLSIIKEPDEQIDYGTGKDVSAESIADADQPLRIQWYGDSFVDIPIWR